MKTEKLMKLISNKKTKRTAVTVLLVKMGCVIMVINTASYLYIRGSIPPHSTKFLICCKDTKSKFKAKCF